MSGTVIRADTSIVYPNVSLGDGSSIGDHAIVGLPAFRAEAADLYTVIGADSIVRSHTVIYAGTEIGCRLQTGHGALIRETCRLGDDVSIGSHAVLEHHVRIGDAVRIHSQAFIPEYCELEDDVWIGPHVVLTNARYPQAKNTKQSLEGVRLMRGVKVGANATILPGVVVGPGSLIGAGSVVVKDIPAGVIVAGNPARVLRRIDEAEAYRQ